MKNMKRLIIILLACCLLPFTSRAQQLDSAKRVLLDEKLSEYVAAIETAGTDVQKEECDFLISSTTDSLVRQHVALRLYDYYMNSKIMGAEAVAIHIFDTWFLPGKVSMENDIDMLNARVYADFNRQSLIGERAPELTMETLDGEIVTLFKPGEKVKRGDRHIVLFFYDTGCAKCKVESILLSHLLVDEDYPIDFYAIYTGDDREAWEAYVSERFDIPTSRTKITHLWDPTLDSDFQRKYGILQTPRMYLVRPDKVIKGRGLDTYALAVMLNEVFSHPDLDYGDPRNDEFFDQMMVTYSGGKEPTEFGVQHAIMALADTQLAAGDTTMCRQMVGDLLYYLAPKSGRAMKEGTHFLINRYINGRDDIWKSADDSLKVIGFAEIQNDLLSKALPGTVIADVKVPGELITPVKTKNKTVNLRKLKGDTNVIIFHTEGCKVCEAEITAARSAMSKIDPKKKHQAKVLLVNVDDILASDPRLASRLFDCFDLASLPYIVVTDKKGVIFRRYITLQENDSTFLRYL